MRRTSKFSIVMMCLLLVFTLGACSSQSSSEDHSSSTDSKGNFSFSYMMAGKYINWLKDLNWYPELQKQTHTTVKLVEGGKDDDDYYKNIDLKIGSGDFADAGIVKLSQAEVYGKQGAFLDLKPLIDKYAPNIKAYIKQNPDYAKLITTEDGKIFGLMQEYTKISNVTFYRADMFEKAGITQAPRTIQEFTADLQKLKDTYKNVENFYPFTGRDGFIKFTEAYDAMDKIDANGKVHGIYNNGKGYDIKAPGFKSLIEQYINWYNAGLIDPEWIAGVATEESWQTKMLNGKGAISNDFFTRPSWFMNNGGPTNDPKFSMKVMNPFLTMDGKQSKVPTAEAQYRMDRAFVINANAEDKAEGIIKYMDYVFSEKGRNLMDYGVEGKSYKEVNNKKEFTVKFEEEGNKPIGTPVWNFLQDRLTFPAPANNDAYYQWMDDLTKSYATTYFNQFAVSYPSIKYSTKQLEERSTLQARVEEELNANLVKFITGKRPMSEWDSFLKEMDNIGYSKIIKIDQAAYNAMKK
ncbi:extracellular solute-binding protein [Neobacillus cucumis]|uniref:extracellular solute-binding protein n=1 Tax=Neobacillus cucumis TaxID=1740721 RepID=UPI0028531915|nr:extracellular solute-binding protein [Neobacillus cucumis]MDR4949610.1 extracellular solute-binding protein [Neobacillus cucumis]